MKKKWKTDSFESQTLIEEISNICKIVNHPRNQEAVLSWASENQSMFSQYVLVSTQNYVVFCDFYLSLQFFSFSRVWGFSTVITKTCLYNTDPLKPHFYIVKLGFTEVYIIFLISAQKHILWVLVRTASWRRF